MSHEYVFRYFFLLMKCLCSLRRGWGVEVGSHWFFFFWPGWVGYFSVFLFVSWPFIVNVFEQINIFYSILVNQDIILSGSCEIVALRENFVDRPRRATIRSALKVMHFLRSIWDMYSHTQPDQKQGIKKFVRHLPTTFVPLLTLQSWFPFATWPSIEISNMANDKRKFKCGTFKAGLDDIRYL
jgi:hypothetical protein